jgi:hypothetical protein
LADLCGEMKKEARRALSGVTIFAAFAPFINPYSFPGTPVFPYLIAPG